MTQNEIIEMARKSGFSIHEGIVTGGVSDLERFDELVTEKERETCAKLVDYWEAREGEHADAIRARGQS
jgi:hypothetical protein